MIVAPETSDRRWLIPDQLGSIVAITDADGELIGDPNTYDEYGRPGASNAGRFQFTGQIWLPEADVYHYKARAYAPSLGRFLQTDPILYAGGMNLYTCAANDPVNRIDPFGLWDSPRNPPIVVTAPRSPWPDHGTLHNLWAAEGLSLLNNPNPGWQGGVGEVAEIVVVGWRPDDEGRPLDRCERRSLWGFLPAQAIDAARIHEGLPFPLASHIQGITLGNNIFFRPGAYDRTTATGLALLAEEVAHVSQYQPGPETWGLDYLSSSILAAASGRDPYWNNMYEVEAQHIRQQVLEHLTRNGGSNGCPPY